MKNSAITNKLLKNCSLFWTVQMLLLKKILFLKISAHLFQIKRASTLWKERKNFGWIVSIFCIVLLLFPAPSSLFPLLKCHITSYHRKREDNQYSHHPFLQGIYTIRIYISISKEWSLLPCTLGRYNIGILEYKHKPIDVLINVII